jgi:predicted ATP-grasp superfamily ATP-dependent carboligase/protein-tyrosine-phosphatase
MGDRVLVLGEDNRNCLTIVRSLGRQGLEVWLGPETRDSIVPRSRYVRRTIPMPSTKERVNAWLDRLEELLSREKLDLVIPSSDHELVPMAQQRARFEPLARLAIPDDFGFEHTYLKSKTLELADRVGVPIPRTTLVEKPEDLAAIVDENPAFPLIVKPVSSNVWKGGARFDLKVRTASDESSLESIARGLLEIGPVLIQSYFEGRGVGQEFLASEGEILDVFQHERVHEPLSGGGSSYRMSVLPDERMLDCSKRLLSGLRWTGVAMVEYRQNVATGEFVLMEINGRFWGSLPLAVAAGVDFPYRAYRVHRKQPVSPAAPYRRGLYCRNFSRDLAWFKERLAADEGSRLPSVRQEIGAGLKNVLAGRERCDTITLDDPLPGIAELWNGLKASGAMRARKRTVRAAFELETRTEAWRRSQRRKLRRLLDANPRMLFVCRGNICRSPFAERYARRKLDEAGLTSIETASAGSYPVLSRPSPEAARLVGRELGVPLEDHRSTVLDLGITSWPGAILCMDRDNAEDLRLEFPDSGPRIFYLGAFDRTARRLFIDDPWNKPADEFRKVYAEIASSIDGLVAAIRERA